MAFSGGIQKEKLDLEHLSSEISLNIVDLFADIEH